MEFWQPTNKKVEDLVSDLSATWSPTSRRPGLRQDRSNGIWALVVIELFSLGVTAGALRAKVDRKLV